MSGPGCWPPAAETPMRALLFAMGKEAAPPFTGGQPVDNRAGLTLRRLSDGLLVCVCGVGKGNAALAAQLLIDQFQIQALWNAGVSGCFQPLPVGTLIAATACVQHDLDTFGDPPGQVPVLEQVFLPCAAPEETAARLCSAGLPCTTGVVATGDWFGRDFQRARRIRDQFGALACDMEAGAAAQVCLRNQVPFHCLKVVSDHLAHPAQYDQYQKNLPAAVERLNRALEVLLKEA